MVTPLFHPSDVGFALRWSERAPGIDGWRVQPEPQDVPERVLVTPPGSRVPVFVITRPAARVLVERQVGEGTFDVVGEYDNLRLAVQALCPIPSEELQEINEELELSFPRGQR